MRDSLKIPKEKGGAVENMDPSCFFNPLPQKCNFVYLKTTTSLAFEIIYKDKTDLSSPLPHLIFFKFFSKIC